MVRNAYQGFGSEYETLLGAFDKDIACLKRRVGKDRALGTYKLQVRSRNVNYWSVCKKLKPVMKECGIDKPISAHCARHGFSTMALTNGMPIESVIRVLGHTNIVTTQIYARITTQKLDTDLTMLGNKLNQSFSNIKRA